MTGRRIGWGQRLAPYLFLLPNLLIFGVFTIYPALNSVNISFYESSNGRTFRPVGLDNYRRILSDEQFWSAAANTLVFVLAYVLISVLVALGVAVLLNRRLRGRGFFRATFFLPMVLSPVVVGLVWGWLLQGRGGLINTVLGGLGLPTPGWLVDPALAMVAAVGVGVWIHLGFYALILLAGLQAIDPHLHEAAALDGAGPWQRFRLITVPLLRPTTLVVLVLATIAGFQSFDFLYSLTGGGPLGATTLLVQYIYQRGFESPISYGLASAGSVLLFVVILLVTLVQFGLARRREAV
ncbi:carbohydrate ABC transporter permease [Crossiella cryophila]|uniref:ABC-type sugar transport system permease subunit n=1 Tax=Crossiella cryophila TaxID=43355 RepID=A0A7W7C655_9PSEU|nr:sugar ABC transporter permease [Crossiella cryophila]MBB4675250.1 ABC-type sugar transport system permease subunit [Crossiella cryophila]